MLSQRSTFSTLLHCLSSSSQFCIQFVTYHPSVSLVVTQTAKLNAVLTVKAASHHREAKWQREGPTGSLPLIFFKGHPKAPGIAKTVQITALHVAMATHKLIVAITNYFNFRLL